MPYYVPDNDRELAEKLVKTHTCSVCGRRLYIYLESKTHNIYVACSDQHEHIEKVYEPTRFQKDGLDSLNIEARRDTLAEQYGDETSKTLLIRNVPLSGVLTKEQATVVLKTIWKDAPDVEVYKAAVLCRDYGLHPLMKHLFLIPFGQGEKRTWVTVLGINATRLIMSRRGSFSYLDNTPRIMTTNEEKEIFGEIDETKIRAITKLRTRDGLEAQGYGHWDKETTAYGAEKGNTQANMAFIRSERNAFSRLFPDALPQGIEVVDESYVVGAAHKIDRETGEIIDTKAQVVPDIEKPLEVIESEAEAEPLAGAITPELGGLKPDMNNPDAPITGEQLHALSQLCIKKEMSLKQLANWCNDLKGRNWGIKTFNDLKQKQLKEILDAFIKGESKV